MLRDGGVAQEIAVGGGGGEAVSRSGGRGANHGSH